MRAASSRMLAVASIAALVGVRVISLGADPPPWLSWSGGLATDEGFYTLDARHLVLFGTWARGDFHDRLLSPLLSVVQQGVFSAFGAGLVQARAIDAALGLLTIGLLWLGLRASCDGAAAHAGALLLGFAPPFVFYNRMALQETPAAFCLTLSFALWAMAMRGIRNSPHPLPRATLSRKRARVRREAFPLSLARMGCLIRPPLARLRERGLGGEGSLLTREMGGEGGSSTRGLGDKSFPAAPAPASPNSEPTAASSLPGALLVGAGVAAGAAFLCKGLAIVFFPALGWAAMRSGRRGWAVAGGLALVLGLYGVFWYGPHHAELARMGTYYRQHQFLPHSARSLWLNMRRAAVGDRAGVLRGLVPYLLLFVPVPCALAATRLRRAAARPFAEPLLWLWLAGGALFCAASSYAPDRYYVLFLPPLCGLAGLGLAALAPVFRPIVVLAACVVNIAWLGAAWHGRTWTAQSSARTLSHLLPARSVVAGDMAPAVCLGTGLDAAPVQPGLSNSVRPVETLGADYIAITRAPVYARWWRARYPQIVGQRRPIVSLPIGTRWTVDVYGARP